jgi:hypothetical protein
VLQFYLLVGWARRITALPGGLARLLALMQPIAWKGNSANVAVTKFVISNSHLAHKLASLP